MAADGRLWMATVNGLAMMDTKQLPKSGRKPKVFIAGVATDGARSRVGNELLLAPGIHHVELSLAAVDLATPQKTRLQYRMEGVDAGVGSTSTPRAQPYTPMSPRARIPLEVRATDSLGNWDAGRVVYTVTQQPYFYQTRLFLAGAIALTLLLVIAIYLVRVRHVVRQTRTILEERQVERESVARDLHDTFLQGIQGLILLFHTGTQQLPRDQPVRQMFEDALRQSDEVLLEGRSVLSRLRGRRTTSETLAAAFAGIGRELHPLSAAQFDVAVSGRARDLNTVAQEEVYKVGREALFNAFRHAKAGRIEVELHFGLFEFRVRFRDDGVGIDPAVLRDGERARALRLTGDAGAGSRRSGGTWTSGAGRERGPRWRCAFRG